MEATHFPSASQKPHPIEPILITMDDLQRLLGCGKTQAFALIAKGEIEAVSLGRRRMPLLESAKAYVQRLRQASKEVA